MKRYTLLYLALLAAVACNSEVTGLEPPSDPATETFAPALGVDLSQMTRLENGVYYQDLVIGSGLEVTDTAVTVNATYAGYLKDGKLVDSGTNQLFVMANLIPGLRTGILGMLEGGKRKLVVPSQQGYGRHTQRGSDGKIVIPRQSTLVFDIEILTVTNPTPVNP